MRVSIGGRTTPWQERARCLSDVACGLTAICCCARRSWIPARRERVFESNGVFSSLIKEGYGLRETRITRIRRRQTLWKKRPPKERLCRTGSDPSPALGPAEADHQRGSASRRPARAFYEIVSKALELGLFPIMHMYSSCIFVHVAWFRSSRPLGHENSFHMAQFSRGRLGR